MIKLLLATLLTVTLSYGVEKPNVIYINVDDLGWADVAYQGSSYYETPHIDAMAMQGMVFSNGYASAANCAPSRACAISGQFSPRHGVYTVKSSERGQARDRKVIPTKNTLHLTSDVITLGHAMKKAGYLTATMGKWHVTKDPLKNGFDINVGGTAEGGPYTGGYHSPYSYPNLEVKEEGTYLTDHLTTKAIDFITENQNIPFFLYLPYFTVHLPIQGKQDKTDYFKKKPGSNGQTNAEYAAMISSLDDNIGRLTKVLDDLKLAENTVIIFTSDNGGLYKVSQQKPLRAGKGSYYEGGIRVPLIIRWSSKVAPSINETPVTNLDFFPTLLDITKTSMEGKVIDGDSLLPVLMGGSIQDRSLYWHFPVYLQAGNEDSQDRVFRTRPGSAIRDGDWKLIQYFENNDIELYNLNADLGERVNLATKNSDKATELLQKLDKWRAELHAPVPKALNPSYRGATMKKGKKEKG